MNPETLFDYHVEVRQGSELIHCWSVGANLQQLISQLLLDFGGLGQSKEAPCCSGARCFMASCNKAGESVMNICSTVY